MANDDVTGGSGSGALREDMISNAVGFLKHPQVRILDAPGRRAPITSRAARASSRPRDLNSPIASSSHRPALNPCSTSPVLAGHVQPRGTEETIPGEEGPKRRGDRRGVQARAAAPVSYTHLTLPTICSV